MNELTITLEQFEDVATIENRYLELNKRAANIGKKYGNLLQYTNLKLYDVSSYVYDNFEDDEGIELFNNFASHEFDYFKEFIIDEHNLILNQVGRSSTFVILPDEYVYFLDSDNLDYIDVYECLMIDVDFNQYRTLAEQITQLYNDGDDVSDFIESWLDSYQIDLDQLEENIDLMECYFEPLKNAYDYIESFKANQVELFKEFTGMNEDV